MSVTTPKGFVAAGIAAGIKPNGKPDLALVATDDAQPVPAAAVFTTNKATAAPVQVSRAHLAASGNQAAAVILNSGNANAATGLPGYVHAENMTEATAEQLGCQPEHVLVCSTGLIGIPLPIDVIEAAVPALAAARAATGGEEAATAIMTTDTYAKQTVVTSDKAGYTIGGMAKGAAMLAPNMATMLAVLTTDAVVDAADLQAALHHAVERSFNSLSVDGCTSTNDTVIVLANGRSGVTPSPDGFKTALALACADLAAQMAGDAEGATKVVAVTVTGAASDDEARMAARKIAQSQLVKCSFYGQDPYWGRIVSELGSAGVAFDPDLVDVAYGGITVCRNGVHEHDHDGAALKDVMAQREIEIDCNLKLGDGRWTILTNDLTHAYVDENMGTS